MSEYAQTNLQLYRQLAAKGYPDDTISVVADAYEFGLRLFPGTYRGSGKPFLAHLVGTASVLASLCARTPVVTTGLLHAVYTHGEFGNGWRGMSRAKRAEVRCAVGEEVEDLIARYTQLRWDRLTIPEIRARLDTMTSVERDVLLVRLANELEDHLDLGILYLADRERRREYMQADLPAAIERRSGSEFPRSPRASPRPSRRLLAPTSRRVFIVDTPNRSAFPSPRTGSGFGWL
jgi:(p)ppGpp synthase/HD superfamily hydrolase